MIKPVRIILVGGCFDMIHIGHIEFLRLARKLGEKLIVALESDKNVKERKGPKRPIHSQSQRAAILKSIVYVDEVIALDYMFDEHDYARLVRQVKPTIIAVTKGDPYKAKKEQQALQVGAKVVELRKIQALSSSHLVKLMGVD